MEASLLRVEKIGWPNPWLSSFQLLCVCFWFGLVCFWFGLFLVCFWFGLFLVCFWFGLVCFWFGLFLVWFGLFWFGLVWFGFLTLYVALRYELQLQRSSVVPFSSAVSTRCFTCVLRTALVLT